LSDKDRGELLQGSGFDRFRRAKGELLGSGRNRFLAGARRRRDREGGEAWLHGNKDGTEPLFPRTDDR
jgi:hypothetical protein